MANKTQDLKEFLIDVVRLSLVYFVLFTLADFVTEWTHRPSAEMRDLSSELEFYWNNEFRPGWKLGASFFVAIVVRIYLKVFPSK